MQTNYVNVKTKITIYDESVKFEILHSIHRSIYEGRFLYQNIMLRSIFS